MMEESPVRKGLELLLHGCAELEEVYWSLKKISRSEREMSRIDKWIIETLLSAWADTGYSNGYFATYKELDWLWATYLLASTKLREDVQNRLGHIVIVAPIDFASFDLIGELRQIVDFIPFHAPVHVRIKYLLCVLCKISYHHPEMTSAATKIIDKSYDLLPIELHAVSVLNKLSSLGEFEYAQEIGKLREEIVHFLMGLMR
ncbi:MAG TPA: hypothetical protein VNK96_09745 [Fimbriimonadales bacterium]|nr:hypothetical protein [Fimbriimonadales bacterium]